MTSKERKQQWQVSTSTRRERVLADGGSQLNLLLDKDATKALEALTAPDRSGKRSTKLSVVSYLLAEAAAKLRPRRARAGAPSK